MTTDVQAADWILTRDAAACLGVSTSTVDRLRRGGQLEAEQLGHQWWVGRDSLEAVAAERRRWLSHVSAAQLVGISPSTLSKAVARGEMRPRHVDRALPSLSRDEVLAWAARRQRRKADRQARLRARAERAGPPDDGRVWLDVETTALVLQCSPRWVRALAQEERLPHVRRGRRLWFVREHIEGVSAAWACGAREV